MSAWICGFVGLVASLLIGIGVLELPVEATALCIFASYTAGLCALLGTLKGERTSFLKRTLFANARRTWTVFLTVYFGGMLLIAPPLRDARVFASMVVPLILTTGFTILTFGPIQDKIVASIQRRARQHVGVR